MGKTITLAYALLLIASSVWAGNPADPAGPFRYCPAEFYQLVAGSDESGALLINRPLEDASICLNEWHKGSKALHEISIASKPKNGWQAGIIADIWDEADDNFRFMADYRDRNFGASLLAPLAGDSQVKVTGRVYSGDFVGIATLVEDDAPIWGVSYLGDPTVHLAYSDSKWQMRISHRMGQWTPEARVVSSPDDTIYYLALCFTP